MKRLSIILAAVLVSAPAIAVEIPETDDNGPYASSRKAFVSSGFKPAGKPGEMPGHPEASTCAIDGSCIMRWQRGSTVIEVAIHGYPSEIQGVRCTKGCR